MYSQREKMGEIPTNAIISVFVSMTGAENRSIESAHHPLQSAEAVKPDFSLHFCGKAERTHSYSKHHMVCRWSDVEAGCSGSR